MLKKVDLFLAYLIIAKYLPWSEKLEAFLSAAISKAKINE
jgi:hypothetical protein